MNKDKVMKRILLITAILFSIEANAYCQCKCVNGRTEALCSSALDLEPICPPKICPLTRPSVSPIHKPYVPPIGTTSCRNMQVYNKTTRRYEYKSVCR